MVVQKVKAKANAKKIEKKVVKKVTKNAATKLKGKRGSDQGDEIEDDDEEDEDRNDEENDEDDDGDGSDNDDEFDDDSENNKKSTKKLTSKRKRSVDEEDDANSDDKLSKKKVKAKKVTKISKSSSKAATKKTSKATGKDAENKSSSASSSTRTTKTKRLSKLERLEEARKAYKWWEAPDLPEGILWYHLEHPGIVFAPSYIPHNIPMKYDGNIIKLNSEQEELASFYAAMPEDGPQLGNEQVRKVFQKNFFADFKEAFETSSVIKHFDKCDFSLIKQHLDLMKSLKKAATDEEKEKKKREKEQIQLQYGYALIDGRIEKMGNYNMEPPGLFRGRGEHPKTGSVKTRCFPESVSLNLSEDCCVPKCSLPGHAWQSVRHDPTVTWLCSWTENVQNQIKYVMLAASSSFKGKSDIEKYQTAINLKGCIDKVRRDYKDLIKSKDLESRQLGVAMWVIDVLALRVGGEKGEEEADTVGCCSLRVEHLTFNTSTEDNYEIELEFRGKDSMLFKQNIDFGKYGDLGKQVYNSLKSFCHKKSPTEDVFETLTPTILNKHLQSIMSGLTAKVFRTYNASITLEKELPTSESLEGLTIAEKVALYNAANREVAILCNHQKTVSKATEEMFENLNEKLNAMRNQLEELISWQAFLKKKKADKIKLKKDDKQLIEKLQNDLATAVNMKEKAKTTEEKLQAAQRYDEAKAALKKDANRRFLEKHMYATTPSENSIAGRIEKWNDDIKKMERNIRTKDENKEVALGTSKINYMDPRITVAWCKRCEVPIDKVFAKALRDKFNWAMAVPPEWKFE